MRRRPTTSLDAAPGPVVGMAVRGAVFVVRGCLGFRRRAHGRRVVANSGGDVRIVTVGSHSERQVSGGVLGVDGGTPTASISVPRSMAGSVDRGHHAPSRAPLAELLGFRLKRAEQSRAATLRASRWSELVVRTEVMSAFPSRHEPQPVSWWAENDAG